MKISEKMKKYIIESLRERYDENRIRLNDDLCKIYYDDCQIERMKRENKRIKEIIKELEK